MNRHCEQCNEPLKDRMAKSRRPQARFCSRLCTSRYIAANRLTASITEEQEAQIIELKVKRVQNKRIALQVGCSPNQVRYYFHHSHRSGRTKLNKARYKLRTDVRESLAAEIAAAKAESHTAKPYKAADMLTGELL